MSLVLLSGKREFNKWVKSWRYDCSCDPISAPEKFPCYAGLNKEYEDISGNDYFEFNEIITPFYLYEDDINNMLSAIKGK